MGYKTGAAALGSLQSGGNDGAPKAEIAKFSSGTTYKVRVKGTEDLLSYHNYGVYKKVHSFVPKNPAERNERGFITGNPTPWDKAAQYYYDKANAESDAVKKDELQKEGYKYRGKEKFLLGFNNLETGEDFVVDLTKQQALDVYAVITKYEKRLGKIAFELSKTGASTATKVSLSPIIDMEEDLSDAERANFAKADQPFNADIFDGILFEADEKTQIENLVAAGFDISLIGLSIGGQSQGESEVTEIGEGNDLDDGDLPF